MANKINEIKGKVKGMAVEAKDWVVDHKFELAFYGGFYGAIAGVLAGSIVLGRHNSKKYEKAWRAAKEAYENGRLDSDFGPYKVMRFFEPSTGDFLGETMCHNDSVKAFLNLK